MESPALLPRRIFRSSSLGALLCVAGLVAGCSATGLDEDVSERTEVADDIFEDLDGGGIPARGRARDGSVTPFRMRDGGGRRDAVARDARVLLDARLSNDGSTGDGGERGPGLICPPDSYLPVHAAGLRPLEGYDYIAVREAAEGVVGGDAGGDGWSSTAFRTLSEAGMRCARAAGSACLEKLAHHPQLLANPVCTDHCSEHAIVTTRGNEVRRWATPAELRTLFGPIDSGDEALMLVAAEGYWFACGDAVHSSLREVEEGYEVVAIHGLSLCPSRSELVQLHVSLTGAVTVRRASVLPAQGGPCVGQVQGD